MLFTSPAFFILLFITLLLYYAANRLELQKIIIIASSFIFYAWHTPLLLTLLCFSILINACTVKWIKTSDRSKRKFYATFGVVLNLTILAFFKYSPLLGRTFFDSSSSISAFLISIPLPIGISFFTFQGLSLVIDVFRGEEEDHLPREAVSLLESISMYIAFFPQLIAGPVVKAHEFLPQIGLKYFKNIDWEYCIKRLIIGYFLKMVIADNLKDHTFWMEYPYFLELSGINLLALLLGYSMQIFADFAGYSSIALGLAGLFGYKLLENFMFPYISKSFSEFWRRWHISLSSFLKEYLYISLGGNRKGKFRTYFNLMMTMVLGGFWHGAAWSYAVWGATHGMALALERLINDKMNFRVPKAFVFLKIFFVFMVVSLLWLLFRLPEFSQVLLFLNHLFYTPFFKGLDDMNTLFFISMYSLPVVLYHFWYLGIQSGKATYLQRAEPFAYSFLLFMILVNSGSSGSFIYFEF